MLRIIKILFTTLFSVAVLLVLAFVGLVFFVDPNNYKDTISKQIYSSTGQQVVFNGKLNWTLFPWLGLEIHNAILKNPSNFANSDFASIEDMNLRVQLMPLFQKKVEFGKISLKGLHLNLIKLANGQSNWQTLSANKSDNTTPSSTSSSSNSASHYTLSVSAIDVKNAEINYIDQSKNQNIDITNLNLQSQHLNLNQSFPINLDANYNVNSPKANGHIHLVGIINPQSKQITFAPLQITSQVNDKKIAKTQLSLTTDLNGLLDLTKETLQLNDSQIKVANVSANINANVTDLLTTPKAQGNIDVASFNLKQLLNTFGQPLSARNNASALSSVSLQSQFAYNQTLNLSKLVAHLDNTTIQGNASVNPSSTATQFNFTADKLNINDYLAKDSSADTATSSSAATSTTASSSATNSNPFSGLRSLILNGQFKVQQLQTQKLVLNNVSVSIASKAGIINITPIKAQIFDGQYQGSIKINAQSATPQFAVQSNLTNIPAEKLYRYATTNKRFNLTGNTNAQINVTASGMTSQQVLQSLNGTAHLAVTNGVLSGIDIQKIVQNTVAAINRDISALTNNYNNQKSSASDQTPFSSLTGTINFANGIASNNDLALVSPAVHVSGNGAANLMNQTINYKVNAALQNSGSTRLENVQKILNGGLPILVTGSLSSPKIYPDIGAIAKAVAQITVQKNASKITDKISKQIGGQIGDAIKNNSQLNDAIQKGLGSLLK